MESDKQRSEIILIFLSKYKIKDDYKNCFILQFRKHIFFYVLATIAISVASSTF